MKLIKVTYRAVFQQPIGVLNPMRLKVPGPFPVEVFNRGGKWLVRELTTGHRVIYQKLVPQPSASTGMSQLNLCFDKQIEAWQMWGEVPEDNAIGWDHRPLFPREVALITKDGIERVYWKEAEDFTHILHVPTMDLTARVPAAACGQAVPSDSFINNKANIEPTCLKCAEIWREHYQEKRA